MPLPLILDIVLGLVLIYLLLSLLASEIQELIATVLQWRAEHLKKSIEILVTGSAQELPRNRRLANELYQHPMIQALNHQAKGPWVPIRQRLYRPIERLYRSITKTTGVFAGQGSGPSYIPANVFAIALLKTLHIEELAHAYSEILLRNLNADKLQLIDELLVALRNSIGDDSLLQREYDQLTRSINELTATFIKNRSSVSETQARSVDLMVQFIAVVERQLGSHDYCKAVIRQRLPYLRQFVKVTYPEPTISEVVSLLTEEDRYDRLPPELMDIVLRSISTEPDYYTHDSSLRDGLSHVRENQAGLPQQLRDNLRILASQADQQAHDFTSGLRLFQTEVEAWFNRSMDRASGVYKRNAKGVAILIGIVLAIAVNADTFHIMSRLARDSMVREALREAAAQTAVSTNVAIAPSTQPISPRPTLETVEANLDQALNGLPLPIGWSPINIQQQQMASRGWRPPFLRRLVSWVITGIAISMGASFWYGALSRVAPIRNTGKPVGSSTPQK